MTLAFWITSLVVTATPGTGALYTMAAGLSRGMRAALVAAVASTIAIVPHLLLAITGATALLVASPVAFQAVKWLGVAYLLYLAWGMWRQRGALDPEGADSAERGVWRVVREAVLVNLLNPKLTIFFLVFLPSFVDPTSDGAAIRMIWLGLAFMAVTLVVFVAYGAAAGWLGRFVVGRPVVMRWLNRGFAATFVVLAVVLAFATH